MQILSVTLKNIKSHRDLELDFVKGINVLSGDNGAGKSTVFEAVGYALFGVDARDFVGNIDRFITIGEKKGEIAVTFAAGDGETYRVSRSVGAGSKWLLAKQLGRGFEVEDHAGAGETEARIRELLGLDSGRSLAEQYKLVIGPFQNEFLGPFVIRQPKKRQEAFDEILGIDAWRKTYKGTGAMLKAIKNRIEVLAVEIEGKLEQVAPLEEREKEMASLTAESEAGQKELAQKKTSLAEAEKRVSLLDEREKKANAAKAEIRVLENRLQGLEGRIREQGKRVAESEKALEILEKNRPGKEAFETAEARLKSLREQEQRKKEIEREIIGLDKESVRLAQKYEHELREVEKTGQLLGEEEERLKKELQTLTPDEGLQKTASRLDELRGEEKKLRSARGVLEGRRTGLLEGREKLGEGVCPFFKEPCLNIGNDASRDVFSGRLEELDRESLSLAEQLKVLAGDITAADKARQELEAIKVKARELEKQRTALAGRAEENNRRRQGLAGLKEQQGEAAKKAGAKREELQKFAALDSEIAQLEKERTGRQAARDAFVAHQKDALDLAARRETLQEHNKLLEEAKGLLTAKKNELAGLEQDYDPKLHGEARLVKEKLVAEVAAAGQKIDGIARDLKRLAGDITRLRLVHKEITARQAEKKGFEKKEELVGFLRDKVFNNVSARLSERFREEISLRADRIYRTIAETDEELHWGDQYRIVLRDMREGVLRERSDEQLSGGQTMSAVVSLRLALLQTIGARVAFFDEPTSNLDAARRANLAHAFRAIDVGREEVAEHWYDQLFLISHDVAFTEVTDQVISLDAGRN